jgi:hypothetical protein
MMNELPSWVLPLLAVVVGLALGLVVGAKRLQRSRGERADRSGVPSRLGAEENAAGKPANAESTPQQRLLERLRAANLQLSAQLKSLAESNSRQAQEREQERQTERLRNERALEELRQAHAGELSHLMSTLVDQIDALNRGHGEQLRTLETEIDRLRQDPSRRSGYSSGPGALGGNQATRPLPMGGREPAQAPAPSAPGTRSSPTDYSVTLPMESFRER